MDPDAPTTQGPADLLVLLPVFHLANPGAVENVSAFMAAGESKARRLKGIAAEALHKHD